MGRSWISGPVSGVMRGGLDEGHGQLALFRATDRGQELGGQGIGFAAADKPRQEG